MWYNISVYAKTYTVLWRKEVLIMKVTVDTIIGDILDFNGEAAAAIFLAMGMHCLGCPSARGESVAEAYAVHGVDPEQLVKKLNEAVNK